MTVHLFGVEGAFGGQIGIRRDEGGASQSVGTHLARGAVVVIVHVSCKVADAPYVRSGGGEFDAQEYAPINAGRDGCDAFGDQTGACCRIGHQPGSGQQFRPVALRHFLELSLDRTSFEDFHRLFFALGEVGPVVCHHLAEEFAVTVRIQRRKNFVR